jgi:cytochrome c oxidase subunit III
LADHPLPSGTYQLGVWLAVSAIASFFIALMLAYSLAIPANAPPVVTRLPWQVWMSTLLLALSSGTLEWARYVLRRGRALEYLAMMRLTLVFGVAFVAMQALAWWQLAGQGVQVEGNPRGSAFFVFSGLHAAHVLGGLISLGLVVRRGSSLAAESELRRARNRTQAAGIYWHFMGLLWIALLILLLQWTR